MMDLKRVKFDFKYMLLNFVVNKIPCWTVRRFFYCLSGMRVGKRARVGIGSIVISPGNISIGEGSIVNEFCYLDGRGGLEIGMNTSISVYTMFLTGTHDINDSSFSFQADRTIVGNNVWTGTRAIVLNGSVIENGAVIGAGSVFKGRADENAVYIGNPAKKVKERQFKIYSLNYKPYFR